MALPGFREPGRISLAGLHAAADGSVYHCCNHSHLPAPEVTADGRLKLEFLRPKKADLAGLRYQVEFNHSLDGEWAENPSAITEIDTAAHSHRDAVSVMDSETGLPRRFARVLLLPEGSAAPSGLLYDVNFNQAATNEIHDANGTLLLTADSTIGWGAGVDGGAASFDGQDQFLRFVPTPFLTELNDFTISIWIRLDERRFWARVFDFGPDRHANMFLTVSDSNGLPRYAITTNGASQEEQITGNARLPVGKWLHLALTMKGKTGRLYVNGSEVGVNHSMTLGPSDFGLGKHYLGKSKYPGDPLFKGAMDQLKIFDRALTPEEIGLISGAP